MSEPTITISYAQSVDGRIATATGDSRWISCQESLEFAHTLRGSHDAIMVGIGTVLADDPRLTCRLSDCQSPHRFILDSRLRLPLSCNITQTAPDVATTVVCANETLEQHPDRVSELQRCNVSVRGIETDCEGLSLPGLFELLAEIGIHSVFVEGGSRLITTLIRRDFVDRLIVVMAPLLIGSGCEAIGDLRVTTLKEARRATPVSVTHYGCDIAWELHFERPAATAGPIHAQVRNGEHEDHTG